MNRNMVRSPDDENISGRPTAKVCHETRAPWPTMTVLCDETRAAVLEENLNRKISATGGVDTTPEREQVICARTDQQQQTRSLVWASRVVYGESRNLSSLP